MELKTLSPSELNWNLDFTPRSLWPSSMPIICVLFEGRLEALCGFEQKTNDQVNVLLVDAPAIEICTRLYENLGPFEELRLLSRLKIQSPYRSLLSLPKDLQNYCDDRKVSLKVLKPLEHLTQWTNEITQIFLNSKPSASQVREILDLLCDLKFLKKSWLECSLKSEDPQKWILTLRQLRFPRSLDSDDQASRNLQSLPWPKGVHAKWERQGDQAGISIQARVNNLKEWKNLKESFEKLDLKDNVWKT